jgi:hypothetical protein
MKFRHPLSKDKKSRTVLQSSLVKRTDTTVARLEHFWRKKIKTSENPVKIGRLNDCNR